MSGKNPYQNQRHNNPYNKPYGGDVPAWGSSFMAADGDVSARTTFIRLTYLHLAIAIALFVAIEFIFFMIVPAQTLDGFARLATRGWNWLIVMGAFMGVSYLAQWWATSSASKAIQYAGLLLYVAAQAVITLPLLYFAHIVAPGSIGSAALMSGIIFGGLSLFAFVTKADFSWLGRYLMLAMLGALGFIICSIVFRGMFQNSIVNIGLSCCMIVLMCGYILYYTSNVLHHYRTDQYVAASLALFASLATLFWYVLRLMMAMNRR